MSSFPQYFDRVQESSTTTGTNPYVLAGAITGFRAFSTVGDGKSCCYCAQDVDANGNPSGGWEVGIGTYTALGTTLSRDTILASSNSNNAVNWGAGTRRIYLTLPAEQIVTIDLPATPVLLPNPKLISIANFNLPIADTDLYTVPSGRRALVRCLFANNLNPASGSVTMYWEVKVSGTYYRLRTGVPITAASSSATDLQSNIVLEAGDTFAINTSVTAGLNIFGHITEFDNTSPLKCPRLLGMNTGDNTLYTVPAGKRAVGVGPYYLGFGNLLTMLLIADGTNRTMKTNLVPNGSSPSTANQLSTQTVNANSSSGIAGFPYTLTTGDFINVNVSTGNAAQSAWQPLLELSN